MRPVLFYTVGYPGAGKTTLAVRLSHWLGARHLRGDKIGLELFQFPTYSPQERAAVYQEMSRRAGAELQAGRHVIYDAATNTVALRTALHELAHAHGGQAIGLWVEVPVELAKQRAGQARDQGLAGAVVRVIPPHIFDQYVAAFEAPRREAVLRIPGDLAFPYQYRHVQQHLGQHTRLPRLVQ